MGYHGDKSRGPYSKGLRFMLLASVGLSGLVSAFRVLYKSLSSLKGLPLIQMINEKATMNGTFQRTTKNGICSKYYYEWDFRRKGTLRRCDMKPLRPRAAEVNQLVLASRMGKPAPSCLQ